MVELHADLTAKGIKIEGDVHPAWGAQGYGPQFEVLDPDDNKIELRCYQTTQ